MSNPRRLSASLPLLLVALLAGQPSLRAQPEQQAWSRGPGAIPPASAWPVASPRLREIFAGGVPRSVAELKEMEAYVQALHERVLRATVRVGTASGVLVAGGYVLSAGHVTTRAGRKMRVVLNDGRSLQARTLGLNRGTDTGLLELIFPAGETASPATSNETADPGGSLAATVAALALEMGRSTALEPGAWCVMLGFPGGPAKGGHPPLRLGRVLQVAGRGYLTTDCCMSAGDSGGPLFDMQGRVIGINSRINRNLAVNMHVPIDAFHQEWSDLLASKVSGVRRGEPPIPGWIGLLPDLEAAEPRVRAVVGDSPAARAGIRAGDVIRRFDRRKVRSARSLSRLEERLWPGDTVKVFLERSGAALVIEVVVDKDPEHKEDGE